MSNIFHEIKRGFLVLGFTGPLSSGCTTAANFFENDLNKYIKKGCNKALPKIEFKIKGKYKEFNQRKIDLITKDYKKQKLAKYQVHRNLNKLSYQLKELLNLRETLSILKEYQGNNFKYISMTEMLLKLTIENLSCEEDDNLNGDFTKLKELIKFDTTKLAKAKEINDQIKNRELSELKEVDIDIYEEYLDYISTYRNKLKEHFTTNKLGDLLQDLGDNARRCGNPIKFKAKFKKQNPKTLFILAEEANNIIKFYRNKKRDEFKKDIYKEFVIEAFRNPYEIEYFRNRYYEFYLFSIYTPLFIREDRPNYNKKRDKRDQGRGLKPDEFYKQNVSECVQLSDIAVNNDTKMDDFVRKLSKYFSLICRPGCISPSEDELFMQQACSMSLKSNCISRQVGAIIIGPRGYIVGAGWNDVGSGQIPCGLRRFSDINNDSAPFPLAVKGEEKDFIDFLKRSGSDYPNHSFCFKDEYSKFKTSDNINSENLLGNWIKEQKVGENAKEKLKELLINSLSQKRLEYCRALHAEENAILQNSIIGGIGIDGATIYTTTFPCELCAKKIYQSRIRKVIYIEPYPESISEDVFFKDGSHSVELKQFEGVKSHSYYRLYKATVDKKEFQIQERLY